MSAAAVRFLTDDFYCIFTVDIRQYPYLLLTYVVITKLRHLNARYLFIILGLKVQFVMCPQWLLIENTLTQ